MKIGTLAKGLGVFLLLISSFLKKKKNVSLMEIGAVKPVIQGRSIFCSFFLL
jgi:hypothetical protein